MPPRPFRKVRQPQPSRAATSPHGASDLPLGPYVPKALMCPNAPKPLRPLPRPIFILSVLPPQPSPNPSLTSAPVMSSSPSRWSASLEAHSLLPITSHSGLPQRAPAWPLTLSFYPCPVLSLKQLLFPLEEDSRTGPPLEGDGVPGGSPLSPAQIQEIREELLNLEETIKHLEVMAPGSWGNKGLTQWGDPSH